MREITVCVGLQRAYLSEKGVKYIGKQAEDFKVRVLDYLKSVSGDIFFTREIHRKNDPFYREGRSNSVVGSYDVEIVEMFKSFPKLIINTSRYNALYRTLLDSELSKIKPDRVVLLGVETHTNVLFTAEELRNRDYEVQVYEALTASKDSYMHASGINILSNILSVDVG